MKMKLPLVAKLFAHFQAIPLLCRRGSFDSVVATALLSSVSCISLRLSLSSCMWSSLLCIIVWWWCLEHNILGKDNSKATFATVSMRSQTTKSCHFDPKHVQPPTQQHHQHHMRPDPWYECAMTRAPLQLGCCYISHLTSARDRLRFHKSLLIDCRLHEFVPPAFLALSVYCQSPVSCW